MIYVNGDVYEGGWFENARDGHGTYWRLEYGRHRAEYVGEYRDGKREGFGVFHDALGQRFEGDWVGNKRHGRGRQTRIANAKVEEYQTSGSQKQPGLDVYEGDWVENKRTGQGVMQYANGDVFAGGWLNDEKHGEGVHLYAGKGRAYEGVWDRGTARCGTYREAVEGEAERITGKAGASSAGLQKKKNSLGKMPSLGLQRSRRVETESRTATLRECGAQ